MGIGFIAYFGTFRGSKVVVLLVLCKGDIWMNQGKLPKKMQDLR